MPSQPLVSLITVNYNGKRFLKPLLDSLRAQTYTPLEIIVVDNASSDGSVEWLRAHYPQVKVVANTHNLGFAGGNNSALAHASGEYIGLINNDMIADEQYVEELVRAMQENAADVVGGKILFYTQFLSLRMSMDTFTPADTGGGDTRSLGCMVGSDIGIADTEYKKTLFLENTYGEEQVGEHAFHWVSNDALVKIPVEFGMDEYVLQMKLAVSDTQKRSRVRIQLGEAIIFDEEITNEVKKYSVKLDPLAVQEYAHDVINNAGSEYSDHNGSGKDIGMYEDDGAAYTTMHTVKAVCGGSMLIRKDIIDQYGLFDEYFFMYYEDTDFCWRLNRAGKKLLFQPAAVVRHIHTGSSKEWSPFFRYHVERNRLAMLLKNAAWHDVLREWAGFLLHTTSDVVYMVLRRLRSIHNTQKDEMATVHARAAVNVCVHAPLLLWKRWKKIV